MFDMFSWKNYNRSEILGISFLRGRNLEAEFDIDSYVIHQLSSCGIFWWKRSNSLRIRLTSNKIGETDSIFDDYVNRGIKI